MRSCVVVVVAVLLGCSGDEPLMQESSADPGGGSGADPTGNVEASSRAPGQSCSCDADCMGTGDNPGSCVWGVCMTLATGACSAAGSQAECPDGSRCWNLDGTTQPVCWPDCDAHSCSGTCDDDGSCVPIAASKDGCDASCSDLCPCTAGSCGDGFACVDGACVVDMGDTGQVPDAGPGPDCPGLPPMDCTAGKSACAALTTFNPRSTVSYDDYPVNGESAANQYRSYLRRDFVDLLEYATAKTYCKTSGWAYGNGGALGLGDMSEANGAIPGTSIGDPGHPASTHVNGRDIDLGYYQVNTANNRLRPICPHTSGGQDMYHCIGAPTTLDVYRTAMFLGIVFESPRVRVIGVDGKAGPLIEAAIDDLCEKGWLTEYACSHVTLAYETTNGGGGWYYFHHHHAHISLENVTAAKPGSIPARRECLDPDACPDSLKAR